MDQPEEHRPTAVTSAVTSAMATATLDASEAMGPAGAELARSLPELIEQLKLMREEMEKCSKVYESIVSGQAATAKPARIPSSSSLLGASSSAPNSGASSRNSVSFYGQPVEYRESIYTPLARPSDVDFPGSNSYTRDSSAGSNGNSNSVSGAAMRDSYGRISEDPSDVAEVPPPAPGATNYSRMTKQQHRSSQRLPRPAVRVPPVVRDVDYSVIWVSGECGISLRNFSTNKIGAQIAVLQQADGVTTGISNCRLGDQLVTVNEDPVLDVRFKEIVEKLKTMRRPIKLGFRTNQNVQTSPTASSAPSSSRSRVSRAHPNLNTSHRSSQGSQRQSGVFFPEDEDTQGDRGTMTSVRSSMASNLSDEVELWCREQEEMHSDIIVLLTETVLRCEKLQQENMDQLQNWMHVEPSMYADTSDVTKPTASVATPEES